MLTVGRMCVKIAGRDANKKCVIVDVLDKQFVLIDGETRRRKCNIKHLEPLKEELKIKEKASHEEVVAAFKRLGIELRERKSKPKTERPKKQKKKKTKPVKEKKKIAKKPKEEKPKKEEAKKEEKKEEPKK